VINDLQIPNPCVGSEKEEENMRNLLTISLLAACTGSEKDTAVVDTATESEEDTQSQEDTQDDAFAPAEGDWNLTGVAYSENTCGVDEPSGGDSEGTWTLAMDGAGYSLSVAGYLAPFACVLDGVDLSCEELVFSSTPDEALDATLSQAFTLSMSFSSEESATGVWGLVQTCEGMDCSDQDCSLQGTGDLAK
jgi:hypothetical protein